MQTPPESFPEKIALLKIKSHRLQEDNEEGRFLRALLKECKSIQQEAEEEAKKQDPFGFCKPSYEQALVLNCWLYGIAFVAIYTCNRMGKTAVCWWNFLLWILPNNPKWALFRPYIVGGPGDEQNANNPNTGKKVQVLQRPSIQILSLITAAVARRPIHLPAPDPLLPHYHPTNRPFLQWLQKEVPAAFRSPYPNPPWNKDGTVWYGGPDHDHFKQIIFPLCKEWLPAPYLIQESETDRSMTFEIPVLSRDGSLSHSNIWRFVGKSFEAKGEKWASGAVDAILVTEGMPPDKWKEIKARFKDPGIGSHDFTPFEATNSGSSSALASKILRGQGGVPLPYFVFTGWTVHSAPRHIISEAKYRGLLEAYKNDPEGEARLLGKFYSSSGLVLSNFNRAIHLLDWSTPQLFRKFPTAQLYRGIDPGLDHPTACAWGALLPTNQWVIYRIMCQPGLSIAQRADTIVRLSNNTLSKHKWGPRDEDYYLVETHPSPKSEIFVASPIDYHVFKEDETTGIAFSLNYITAGLNICESTHIGPEERAQMLDNLLHPNTFTPDLKTNRPPGSRVYFLKNEPGIMAAALKWEEFYWDRQKGGDNKGMPKDKVPIHGDDELDAICYLTSSHYRWTSYRPPARLPLDSEPERHLIEASQNINSVRRRVHNTLQRLQNTNNPSAPSGHASNQISYFGAENPADAIQDEKPERFY